MKQLRFFMDVRHETGSVTSCSAVFDYGVDICDAALVVKIFRYAIACDIIFSDPVGLLLCFRDQHISRRIKVGLPCANPVPLVL